MKICSTPALHWPGLPLECGFLCMQVKSLNIGCVNASETYTVLSNGDVVPCCMDLKGDCTFGNITTSAIFDIYANKRYTSFRKMLEDGNYPKMCKNCTQINRLYLTKIED